jgi:pilus assembly protein Flp/PilA
MVYSYLGGMVPSYVLSGMAACRASKGHSMLKAFVTVNNFLRRPLDRDDRGATAVEYGLIVALIAAAIVVTAAALGKQISTIFGNITTSM